MLNWKALPFLRLLMPLILGILLGDSLRLNLTSWWIFAPFLILPFLIRYVWYPMAYHHRVLYGLLANIFFICLGFILITFYPETQQASHYSQHYQKGDTLIGLVSQVPTRKKRKNTVIEILRLSQKDKQFTVSGQLYASFPDTAQIAYGQIVTVRVVPQKIKGARNPYAFSFKKYQYYQNIHFQSFIKPNAYQIIAVKQGNPLLHIAYGLRTRCQGVLQRIMGNSRDYGIASALVLGVKDQLSDDTKEAFASTGSMHVLAVSGLHVGIISIGLRWLMIKLLGRRKSRRWYRITAQLLGVWFFVLLTGASASVLRAGVMFSILEIGLALDRRTSIFNSIAASAYLLLTWNPFLLFQVGFQLSYLALTGIVYFQPYIYKLLVFKSNILNFIWRLTSVSIAAQISTFPISIYYFHQFPLSFFLSGLVVVPAATLLLPFSIFVFLVDFISHGVADFLGTGLAFVYQINSALIFGLSSFQWLRLENLYYTVWTVLLTFGLVFILGLWLKSRRKQLIFYALGIITLLSLERNMLTYKAENRYELAFFSVPKMDVFGLISARKLYRYQSDTIAPKKWFYTSSALKIRKGIKTDTALLEKENFVFESVLKSNNIWNFQGSIIELIPSISNSPSLLKPNITFIQKSIDPERLSQIKADTIILGINISAKEAHEIKQYFLSEDRYIRHLKDGGFILNLNH